MPMGAGLSETDAAAAHSVNQRRRMPWLTFLATVACLAAYAGIASTQKEPTLELLSKWGVEPGSTIWGGAYWPLWTSVFVHVEFWHVACSVYWLWVFGSILERRLGSFTYLLFFSSSAFVTSTFQLAA